MPKETEGGETDQQFEHCPVCGKELRGIRDYPLVLIKDVRRLAIPDYVAVPLGDRNIRDQVAKVAGEYTAERYLSAFESAKGTEVKLSDIEPLVEKDNYFKNYLWVGGYYYIGILESEEKGVAEVVVATSEINRGAAGGPQLFKLAAIAEIHYEGHLLKPTEL